MIQIYHSNGHHIGYDHLTFSGGEEHIRLKPPIGARPEYITVRADLRSAQDTMKLAMIADAMDRAYDVPRLLVCPYFPYARQDRVCNAGEALGAKVMADFINALDFARVEIWDAHSDVSTALLNKCTNRPAKDFVKTIGLDNQWVLISPDAGAMKRTFDCANALGHNMIVAEKHRDTKTGAITETTIHATLMPKKILIVDDICDGGRTFIELAKVIRQRRGDTIIHLYVTHGIFSQGLDVFHPYIDRIYTPNSWLPTDQSFLTTLPTGESK